MLKFHFKLLLAIIILMTSAKCTKNGNDYGIPLVYVNTRINVNNPSFFNLSVTGGWEYVHGGSRGIIVYRSGPSSFNAFDRHAPFDVEANCQVAVDTSNNLIVEDPCSGSRWNIVDGSVVKGPATLPLKPYQTHFDGTYLTITN